MGKKVLSVSVRSLLFAVLSWPLVKPIIFRLLGSGILFARSSVVTGQPCFEQETLVCGLEKAFLFTILSSLALGLGLGFLSQALDKKRGGYRSLLILGGAVLLLTFVARFRFP